MDDELEVRIRKIERRLESIEHGINEVAQSTGMMIRQVLNCLGMTIQQSQDGHIQWHLHTEPAPEKMGALARVRHDLNEIKGEKKIITV